MAGGAIGTVIATYAPLAGVLVSAGSLGLGLALIRAKMGADDEAAAEGTSYAGRILMLLMIMGGFGLVVAWVYGMVGGGNTRIARIILAIAGM